MISEQRIIVRTQVARNTLIRDCVAEQAPKDDTIDITMNSTAISGSPFTSTVGLGPADPASSTATVPGAGEAGTATDITVQARDGSGNALGATGAGATVVINIVKL